MEILLKVPYAEKDLAKKQGAKWMNYSQVSRHGFA